MDNFCFRANPSFLCSGRQRGHVTDEVGQAVGLGCRFSPTDAADQTPAQTSCHYHPRHLVSASTELDWGHGMGHGDSSLSGLGTCWPGPGALSPEASREASVLPHPQLFVSHPERDHTLLSPIMESESSLGEMWQSRGGDLALGFSPAFSRALPACCLGSSCN